MEAKSATPRACLRSKKTLLMDVSIRSIIISKTRLARERAHAAWP